MKKVFIIHGFQGRPNSNWFPWLMEELSKDKIYACVLPMPTPDSPIKDEWVKTIKDVVETPNEEIFLVGHSLGVLAILNYLETLNKNNKIGGAVLASGPISKIEEEGYEQVNSFRNEAFDFDHIKNVCKNFVVIHGDNDTNVPFSDAVELSNKLSCELISISNGGHLNGSDGFYKLPQALESLLKMIK